MGQDYKSLRDPGCWLNYDPLPGNKYLGMFKSVSVWVCGCLRGAIVS